MTVRDADEKIAQWRDKQRLIAENLQSFIELPAYQRLCGKGGEAAQSQAGETQTRIAAAMEVLRGLREQQAILGQTIGRAEELRASLSRLMPSRQTLEEIEQILCGPSIQLVTSPTPPQSRELLRDVTQAVRVSPDRLLEIMLDSFRFVRDTVLAAAAVQQTTPAGAADDAVQQRRAVEARLTEGNSLIAHLRQTHERAKQAFAERELKIQLNREPSIGKPADDGQLQALVDWLARLQRTVDNGEHGPAVVGLRKWSQAVAALLAAEQAALQADEAALSARRDLRGLFDALEAKACQCGRADDPQVAALAQEVRRLLKTRPTPMAQVRELVARYQERLI
jgi:hypothetical protein